MRPAQSKFNILLYFVQRYQWRTLALLAVQLLTGLLEGLGIIALLPLITVMIESSGQSDSALYQLVEQIFSTLRIDLTLNNILILIVVVFSLKALLRYLSALYVSHLSSKITLDFRTSFINALLHSRWSFYIQRPVGTFINALMLESQRGGGSFKSISEIFASFFQMMILLTIAALASWKLVIMGVLTSVVLWVALHRFIIITGQTGLAQKDLSKKVSTDTADILQNYKPLKAMHIEKSVFAKIQKDIQTLFEMSKKQMMAKQSMGIFHEPLFITIMCFGFYGAITYLEMGASILMVLAAVFYRFVISWKTLQQAYQALAGQESFFWSFQDMVRDAQDEQEQYTEGKTYTLNKQIELKNVSFSYDDKNVLSNRNLVIPAKKLIGLVGPSGSGKTTIVDLLCRLYTPDAGTIIVDDVPLEEIDLHLWRRNIGYIPQEFVVFNDNIFNNITLNDPSISEEQVIKALKSAEAWDFIKDLPEGLNTNLGERGGRLSGGQRQRISIARALVRTPRLLIMDEATASLDPKTEIEIFKTLKKLSSEMTIIAISHQNTVKKQADLLIDMAK